MKYEKKFNHLLFMDGVKIFAKSENEVNGLVSTEQILRNDIGMEFRITRCGVLLMKEGKYCHLKQ